MKRIILLITAAVICLSMAAGCSDTSKPADDTQKESAHLVSEMENAIELQKSIFIGEIVSVDAREALIPKYNIDITDYSVYTVNITDSLDGYTPEGEALLYCLGTAGEFANRTGLKKGERYVIDAEPWVYGEQIVYLLSPFTFAYPRIDSVGRVTLEQADGKATDLGTLEEYLKDFEDAKASLDLRIPGFFGLDQTFERFSQMVASIKETNDSNWFREFDYKFVPGDEFIAKTRAYTDKIKVYVDSLAGKEVSEQDIRQIFQVK